MEIYRFALQYQPKRNSEIKHALYIPEIGILFYDSKQQFKKFSNKKEDMIRFQKVLENGTTPKIRLVCPLEFPEDIAKNIAKEVVLEEKSKKNLEKIFCL